jgi:hypothetical protein
MMAMAEAMAGVVVSTVPVLVVDRKSIAPALALVLVHVKHQMWD